MWSIFHQVPAQFKKLIEEVPKMFSEMKQDSDRREKREVYLEIAHFIHSKFHKPLPVCLGTTHILCKESDPRLLEDGVLDAQSEQLAASVKEMLLAIKVSYKALKQARTYNRKIEVLFVDNDKPTLAKAEEEVPWDFLPPDVRESRVRHGIETLTFKLYLQEE